jgi:hypothetical protein
MMMMIIIIIIIIIIIMHWSQDRSAGIATGYERDFGARDFSPPPQHPDQYQPSLLSMECPGFFPLG